MNVLGLNVWINDRAEYTQVHRTQDSISNSKVLIANNSGVAHAYKPQPQLPKGELLASWGL